jgi:hypothetical protein
MLKDKGMTVEAMVADFFQEHSAFEGWGLPCLFVQLCQ